MDGVGKGISGSSEGASCNILSVVFEMSTRGINLLEFSSSQVSELADGILNAVAFGVELLDLVEVFNEDTESGNFLGRGVGLLVLDLPGRPEGRESISSGNRGDTSNR